MLTPKDVSYFNDVLDQTLNFYKRIENEIPSIENEEVKSCFEKVNKQLSKNYKHLVSILQKEAK